jgi:hypothetical protein
MSNEQLTKLMLAYSDKILAKATPDQLTTFASVAIFDQLASYSMHQLLSEIRLHAPELLSDD